MQLNEFLEKFLPEYEQKVRPYEMSKGVLCNAQEFYDKYFTEALQNFADRICKKQRENCYKSVEECGVWKDAIYAEQPKIEEL